MNMRIDDFVAVVKSGNTGGDDGAFRVSGQLIKELKKFSAADLEGAHSNAGLEFSKHAHGLAVLLSAKAANPNCPLPQTLQQSEAFLNRCSAAATLPRTLDKHLIAVLCVHLADRLIQDKAAKHGIAFMQQAIALLAENPHQLTEVHYLLLRLCLESKNYRPALDVLETNLYDIVPGKSSFEMNALVGYYYYGSIILAAHRFFRSALQYVSIVFHIPNLVHSSSQYAVDAFKKYLLLSILARDHGVGIPRYFLRQVESQMQKFVGPYLQLQEQFSCEKYDAGAFDALVEKHAVVFAQDGNMSLIHHVVKRYKTRELLKIAKVYENLQATAVIERLGLTDLEALESQLIDLYSYSDLIGRLDESNGSVFFTKKSACAVTDGVVHEVQDSATALQSIVDILNTFEIDILSDPEYLRKTAHGGEGGSGGGGGMSRDDVLAVAEAMQLREALQASAAMQQGSANGGGATRGMSSRSGRRTMD
ncbi:putative COP9 signalosome complex subunit 3 [Hypsibius exemplaris]|uniref:COP9 signalosome complex subunit 3 n=1 Tax=Hypsibius exemplaris TaxID=2072580 RepID=A0A1W0X1Z3_HYPEX|nr:putative COP9 signalosome complex subunit 3 [Hypsibius exemplaris]